MLFHLPIYRRLSSQQNLLDVVELVQCLYRGEVVDIQTQDFITNLTQYRVVQLEETQLHTLFMFIQMLHVRLAGTANSRIILLQLLQDIVGTLYDASRHS